MARYTSRVVSQNPVTCMMSSLRSSAVRARAGTRRICVPIRLIVIPMVKPIIMLWLPDETGARVGRVGRVGRATRVRRHFACLYFAIIDGESMHSGRVAGCDGCGCCFPPLERAYTPVG